ncbi:unnamed protein product [Ranitomeya imitator]|uniref:Uncharacterized protein n=1 Tax=Ranitomeya imitator TaxID=111125 RepID=A0ABN9MHY8_9NEOB|nr:unnamed protein product [Ranitomeya imitator]
MTDICLWGLLSAQEHSLGNVIDGDLCEQFNSMEPMKQKSVAEELDRTPPEVSKKLEDIRTRYAF